MRIRPSSFLAVQGLCAALLTGCGSLHEAKPRTDVVADLPKERALQMLQEVRGSANLPRGGYVMSEAGVRRSDSRQARPYSRMYLYFFNDSAQDVVRLFVADLKAKPLYLTVGGFYERTRYGKHSGCTMYGLFHTDGQLPRAEMDRIATAWVALGGRLGD